jgi:hypothetical protein
VLEKKTKKEKEEKKKNQYVLLVDSLDIVLNEKDKNNDIIDWSYM